MHLPKFGKEASGTRQISNTTSTILEIKKKGDDKATVKCKRIKGGRGGGEYGFRFEPIDIGKDDSFGFVEPITGCYAKYDDLFTSEAADQSDPENPEEIKEALTNCVLQFMHNEQADFLSGRLIKYSMPDKFDDVALGGQDKRNKYCTEFFAEPVEAVLKGVKGYLWRENSAVAVTFTAGPLPNPPSLAQDGDSPAAAPDDMAIPDPPAGVINLEEHDDD